MGQMRQFSSQKRFALWAAAAVTIYVTIADWTIAPLTARGWFPTVFTTINSLAAVLEFPGYVFVSKAGLRDGHYTTPGVWVVMVIVNAIMWAVGLRIALRMLFPPVAANGLQQTGDGALENAPPPPAEVTSRRRFLARGGQLAVAGVAGAASYSMLIESRWFSVTNRTYPLRGLPRELDGLRVAQLTDIHLGPNLSVDYVREVIRATNELEADLILLTGDYVHRSARYIEPVVRELSQLRARIGIVGTLGNHDWWEDGPGTKRAFANARIPLIDNDRIFLTADRTLTRERDSGLCIAGVGDYMEDVADFNRAVGHVPEDVPRILLSHNPDAAEDSGFVSSKLRVDLMLCGHTHGGQIWVPGFGTPIVPSRYGQKYASGLVQGPACPVFISRGIGMTILPMRFCVPPEIAMITFKSA